ncbi:hypothetical protein HPB48_010199 [Haemaphysalis longicornis]|uniref:Tick transposon n=1 Tax=Haemaphysalis longicornis TaxID=44386 RepID=A0A9J6GPB6_HAELO|nr:hypothetical protein HPB48_010199 [Haemaphysalis longicornis]
MPQRLTPLLFVLQVIFAISPLPQEPGSSYRHNAEPTTVSTVHLGPATPPFQPKDGPNVSTPLVLKGLTPPPPTSTSTLLFGVKARASGPTLRGLGSCSDMPQRLTPLLFVLQVRTYDPLFAKKSSNRCLLQLPSPQCLAALFSQCVNNARLLLLLSGDVEENRGPITRSTSNDPSSTEPTIQELLVKLEAGQDSIISELKAINSRLASTEERLNDLMTRIAKTETECYSIPEIRTDVANLISTTTKATEAITNIDDRINDAEDRSRRNNLLFYGIEEKESDKWIDSEKAVIKLCETKLNVTIDPKEIARAHRLGKIVPGKTRPIIVNFTFFKTRETVLSNAAKLKGTDYSITEDFCTATRSVRRELVRFARERDAVFKIKYKRLVIGSKTYHYDATHKKVEECSSP